MNDLRFALRQLRKSPGFTFVVVITLALGIGANAAIFTLVRGVLIKPLVNRDEDRLIYIPQSAPGMGQENSTWSMPEIGDLKERVKTLSEFGDFSAIAFTLIGLGEPREVNGGVVNGSYFEVMGLHPVLGRLISPEDDGPKAASVLVLTYRFWSDTLNRDPSVIARPFTLVGEEDPRAQYRVISPGFFAALGVPIIADRDFNESDVQSKERVAIISQTLAQRMFCNQDPINRHVFWTDPVLKTNSKGLPELQRIIGVTADIDDVHLVPQPTVTIYNTFEQGPLYRGRLFIHTSANPYSLVTPVTRIIREMSADQPIERAATLEDARAEVLTPQRLNSVVFGVFAAVALSIAVVGVAGVLAFSVSARTREFGIRLALGSQPQRLFQDVIAEGAAMAAAGIVAGALFGFLLARVARSYFADVTMPGVFPVVASALTLLTVAVVASMLPAARAARVDVIQALRTE